jgi:hypothetical protein
MGTTNDENAKLVDDMIEQRKREGDKESAAWMAERKRLQAVVAQEIARRQRLWQGHKRLQDMAAAEIRRRQNLWQSQKR